MFQGQSLYPGEGNQCNDANHIMRHIKLPRGYKTMHNKLCFATYGHLQALAGCSEVNLWTLKKDINSIIAIHIMQHINLQVFSPRVDAFRIAEKDTNPMIVNYTQAIIGFRTFRKDKYLLLHTVYQYAYSCRNTIKFDVTHDMVCDH